MRKKKLSVLLAVILANAICTVLVRTIPLETTEIKLYGSFAAIVLVVVAAWRFPICLCIISAASFWREVA